MSDSESLYQRIESYLADELSEAERRSFESEMTQDASLRQEVQLHRELGEAVLEKEVMQFSDLLGEITQKMRTGIREEKVGVRPLFSPWRVWLVAATLVLILGGVWLFLPKGNDTQALYNTYYQPYSFPGAERGSTFSEFGAALTAGEYKKALSLLQTPALADSLGEAEVKFRMAICYLELEQAEKAIEALSTVAADAENISSEPASWYLALAYLKAEQLEKAKQQLSHIIRTTDSIYKEQAEALLEALPK